jgi:hypothetical protein
MEKTKGCPCGRSPTGVCIGWHALSEEKYLEMKKKYEELQKLTKKEILLINVLLMDLESN